MTTQDKELLAIATLNRWDVPFLSSPFATDTNHPLELTDLLMQLIQSDSTRLKLGVTAFFLVHPEQAAVVLETLPLLKKDFHRRLQYYYTAAVYLQRLWKSQLAGFGETQLPDYFSQELGLPSPAVLHGHIGLAFLEEALQKEANETYNYRSSFDALVQILLQRKEAK